VRLEINCLGQANERAAHRAELVRHFERHAAALDADATRRLHSNPLRILDSKNPAMLEIVAAAPCITDFLGAASRAHFEGLQAQLQAAGVAFTVNPRLVRGLDYYNLTVFEWITEALGSQGTVCGGGRYDPLIERMGGRPTPGIGFGMGIERVIELLKESGQAPVAGVCDAYVLHQGGATQARAFMVAEQLRDAGLDVVLHAGEASMKSQMKKADASGAEYAVIVGEAEMAQGAVAVKALRGGSGERAFAQQTVIAQDRLADALIEGLQMAGEEVQ